MDGAHIHEPQPTPRIGLTTAYPREGRTEEQEWQHVADATQRPGLVNQRYVFFPAGKFPATFGGTLTLAIDQGKRHRMIAVKMPAVEVVSGAWRDRILILGASVPVDGFETRWVYVQEPYVAGYRTTAQRGTYRDALGVFAATLRELDLDRGDFLVGVNLQTWDFDPATGYRGRDYLIDGLDFVGVTALGTDAATLARIPEDLGLAAYHADQIGARFAISSLPLSAIQPDAERAEMMAYVRGFVAARRAAGRTLDHVNMWAGPYAGGEWGPDVTPATLREFRLLIDALR